jgi:exodeoxyribonuclease VII small subunit
MPQEPDKSAGYEGGFDQLLQQLRGIVERLEGGNLSLEQSLAAFEEGVKLSRAGARILDAAEQRVEILLRDEGGPDPGTVRAVPFQDASRDPNRAER